MNMHMLEEVELEQQTIEKKQQYFHGGHWGQCFELIQHLCQYNSSILFVTGEEGLGKSALHNSLLESNSPQFKFRKLTIHEETDIATLMRQIAASFDINWEQSNTDISNISDDKIWVLLIDDAHLLSLDAIKVLTQLSQNKKDTENQIHLVLFANTEFEKELLSSEFRPEFEDLFHIIELEPLSLQEMESYLLFKWKQSGNNTSLPFDKMTLKKIYTISNGVPKQVEQLAKAKLEGQSINGNIFLNLLKKFISPTFVGITIFAGIVFLLLYLFLPSGNTKNNSPKKIIRAQNTLHKPKQTNNFSSQKIEQIENISKSNLNPEPTTTPEQNPLQKQLALQLETEIEKRINLEEAIRNKTEQTLQQTAEINTLKQQIHKQRLDSQQQIEKLKSHLAEAKKSTQVKTYSPDAFKSNNKSNINASNNSFGLQLLASDQKNKINSFIKANKLEKSTKIYQASKNGKSWYVLVYGNYKTSQQAKVAKSTLPNNLKQLQPWVRDIKSLK